MMKYPTQCTFYAVVTNTCVAIKDNKTHERGNRGRISRQS